MFLLHQDIFLWDFLILLALAVTLAGGIGCIVHAKKTTRSVCQSLLGCLGFLGIIGFLIIVYASFIEPQIIVVNRQSIVHPLAEKMTIAIVSDPHVGPYKGKRFLRRVVAKVNAEFPDVVLLPGDFVFTHSANFSDLSPLGDLRTSAGVFAVLGNHDVGQYQSLSGKRYKGSDRGENIANVLMDLGVTVLRNEHVALNIPDGNIVVAGIDDLWTGHHNLPAALDGIEPNAFSILLSHNPSVIQEPRGLDAHLIVSGHTHGGQLRLPGIGPLSNLPTSLGKHYDQGLFDVDSDSILAISRGVGESSPRARLLSWPEILLITVEN